MKRVNLNSLIKFTNGKTKYLVTDMKNDGFNAMRVTSGAKAMWQPIAIHVKVNNDGTVDVTNLNNRKTVKKSGFTVRAPTLNEVNSALKNNNRYKNMKPLDSWKSNRRFGI